MNKKNGKILIIIGAILIIIGIIIILPSLFLKNATNADDKNKNNLTDKIKENDKLCYKNYMEGDYKKLSIDIDDKKVSIPFWKCVEEIDTSVGKKFHSLSDKYIVTLIEENKGYEEVAIEVYQSFIDDGLTEYDELRNLFRESSNGVKYKIVSKIVKDKDNNAFMHIHNVLYPISDTKTFRVEFIYNIGRFEDEFLYEIEDGIIIE